VATSRFLAGGHSKRPIDAKWPPHPSAEAASYYLSNNDLPSERWDSIQRARHDSAAGASSVEYVTPMTMSPNPAARAANVSSTRRRTSLGRNVMRPGPEPSVPRADSLTSVADSQFHQLALEVNRLLYFEGSQMRVRGDQQVALEDAAHALLMTPAVRVRVIGEIELDAPANDSASVAFRRALAIQDFMVQRGVAPARISVETGAAPAACPTNRRGCSPILRRVWIVVDSAGRRVPR
jgi:outer membrane protein OmpA-like peptidoglycan-associated protein